MSKTREGSGRIKMGEEELGGREEGKKKTCDIIRRGGPTPRLGGAPVATVVAPRQGCLSFLSLRGLGKPLSIP